MFAIDLSKNNGDVNFQQVANNPKKIDLIIVKSTEGIGYLDPKLKQNAQGAKSIGKMLTYYHFCSLNDTNVEKDSTAEANDFLNAIKPLPVNDIYLALDIETNQKKYFDAQGKQIDKRIATNADGTTKPGYTAKRTLNPDQFLLWIKTFFSVLNKANKPYMIYSGKYFLDENLPKNHGLGNIPLWLAQYPANYTQNSKPVLPLGWSSCWLWQYACTGSVTGIKGNVDLSRSAAI